MSEEGKEPEIPEAKTMDECVAEIFRTHKNIGNDPKWRVKKSRFQHGELPEHGKHALLKQFGYVLVSQATYRKSPKPNKK